MAYRLLTCECGERMKVPVEVLGRKGRCKRCNHEILVTEQNAPIREDRPPVAPADPLAGQPLPSSTYTPLTKEEMGVALIEPPVSVPISPRAYQPSTSGVAAHSDYLAIASLGSAVAATIVMLFCVLTVSSASVMLGFFVGIGPSPYLIIGFLLSVVSVVLGGISIVRIRASMGSVTGMGMAVGSVVIAILGFVIPFVYVIYMSRQDSVTPFVYNL